MKNIKVWFFICSFCPIIITQDDILSVPTYVCPEGKYFNNIILSCLDIAANYIEGSGIQTCNNISSTTRVDKSLDFTCSSCGTGEIVSQFGDRCVPCNGGNCACEDGIMVDVELNGSPLTEARCDKCTQDYQPGEMDRYGYYRRCVKCPAPNSLCPCTNKQAGVCFPEGYVDSVEYEDRVTFGENQNFRSALTKYYLKGVSEMCRMNLNDGSVINNNRTSCQILTNLCSLVMNQYDDPSGGPCAQLKTITSRYSSLGASTSPLKNVYSRPGWFGHIPWMFYDVIQFSDRVFQNNENILNEIVGQEYTFKLNLNTSLLNFKVVRYSLEGRVYPLETVTRQLSLCGNSLVKSFGTTFESKCVISVESLRSHVTEFLELYLEVGDVLYPVPVLITNTQSDITDTSKWILSRRFFLADSALGKATEDGEDVLFYGRYAKSIDISVKLVKDKTTGNINIPLATITYDIIDYTNNPNAEVITTLTTKYEEASKNLNRDLNISVAVLGSLGLLIAIVRTVSYRRRNNIVTDCSCQTIAMFIYFLLVSCGYLFYWMIAGVTWYYLFFYNGQTVPAVFLPGSREPLLTFVILTFCFLCIGRLYFIYYSSTYDIFFIDWEKPRSTGSGGAGATSDPPNSSISVWRTHFMANEWNELYSHRKINPTLQYLVFLFLTEFWGLKYLAVRQPSTFYNESDVDYVAPYDQMLRIGLITVIFSGTWVLQRIFNFLYERFISDQLQMFVDLCSLSNVSVFILTDTIHGYYIHGRSVHGHADVSLPELVGALTREEANLCAKRGLIPDTDQQTFEMLIPLQLRTHYDRIMEQFGSSSRNPNPQTAGSSPTERITMAYTHLSRLITSFLERSLEEMDYTILDRVLVENVLDIEIRDAPIGKGILYQDMGQSFDGVMCYGNEWLLCLFDIMLVVILDLGQSTFVFSVILAWLINEVILKTIGEHFNQKNVARKALIDERFLLTR